MYSLITKISVKDLCCGNGGAFNIVGDENRCISSVSAIDGGNETSISFIRYDIKRSMNMLSQSECKIVVCQPLGRSYKSKTLIEVQDPRGWFINSLNFLILNDLLRPPTNPPNIGEGTKIARTAVIEEGAIIGKNCRIGDFCYVGSAATLGNNVILQPFTAIGTTGLAFHDGSDGGASQLFPHLGLVRIGDGTQIGTHTTVVRGILKDTSLGANCRLGNYINVGHNCNIADNVFISSGSVIAGGVQIGANARIAAGVKINSYCHIGNQSMIGMGSIVTKSVMENKRVFGNPARELPTLRKF